MNDLSRTVLTSEADKDAAALHGGLTFRLSRPYKIVILCDGILKSLKDSNENTILIGCATGAPALNKSHHVNANNDNISEGQSLTQDTETL